MPSSSVVCGVVFTSLLALAGTAAAQGAPPAEPPPAGSPVRFPALGPDGLMNEADFQIGLHFFEENDDDFSMTSFRAAGQLIAPMGAGGYASLNAARISEDDDSLTGIGNLEVGGLYRIDQDQASITLRAGLALPTGPDVEEEEWLVNYIATLRTRPGDLAAAAPGITMLRMAVAPTYRAGDVFLRADLGLDIAVDESENVDLGNFYHVDVAAGFLSGAFAGTVALSTLGVTGEDANDGNLHALSIGGQYDAGSVVPHAAVVIPFTSGDDQGDDELFSGATVILGLSATM